jgi:hypothetical protein
MTEEEIRAIVRDEIVKTLADIYIKNMIDDIGGMLFGLPPR